MASVDEQNLFRTHVEVCSQPNTLGIVECVSKETCGKGSRWLQLGFSLGLSGHVGAGPGPELGGGKEMYFCIPCRKKGLCELCVLSFLE